MLCVCGRLLNTWLLRLPPSPLSLGEKPSSGFDNVFVSLQTVYNRICQSLFAKKGQCVVIFLRRVLHALFAELKGMLDECRLRHSRGCNCCK